MQDLLIQAQIPEPVPAPVRSTTQQDHAVPESSFNDVLEARLEEREQKKSQQSTDQDQLAAASTVQQPVVQQLHVNPQEKSAAAGNANGQQLEVSLEPHIAEIGQEKAAVPADQTLVFPPVKSAGVNPTENPAANPAANQEIDATAESRGFIPDAGLAPDPEHSPLQASTAEITGSPGKDIIQGDTNQGSTNVKGENTTIVIQAQPPDHNKAGLGKIASANTAGAQLNTLPGEEISLEGQVQESTHTAAQTEEGSTEAPGFQGPRRAGESNPNNGSPQSEIQIPLEGAAAQRTTGIEPARTAEAHQAAFLPQVEESISSMIKSRQTAMQIQLHPEDLGRIQIRLVQDDQGLRVAMRAEQQDTSRLLEQHLHTLQKSLADAGIQLSGFDIGSRSQQNFGQTPDSSQMHSSRLPEIHTARIAQEPERPASYSVDSAVDYRI